MKLFYDFLPIAAFFLIYKLYGIYAATAIAIGVIALQVAITLLRGKRPEMMQLVTLFIMVTLGGATLFSKTKCLSNGSLLSSIGF